MFAGKIYSLQMPVKVLCWKKQKTPTEVGKFWVSSTVEEADHGPGAGWVEVPSMGLW